jgi:hypothetical protein
LDESIHVGGHGSLRRVQKLLEGRVHSHKLFVHGAADRKLAIFMVPEEVSQLFQRHRCGLWPKQAPESLLWFLRTKIVPESALSLYDS